MNIKAILATQDGIEKSRRATSEEWKEAVVECIRRTALKYKTFTSDQVAIEMESVGLHDSVGHSGPVMTTARKRGIIRRTGFFVPSERPQAHMQEKREWESLIYNE